MRNKTKFLVAALATLGIAGGAVAFAAADPVNPQVNAPNQDLTVGSTPVPTFPSVTPTCASDCALTLDAGTATVDIPDTTAAGGTAHVPVYGFNVNGTDSGRHGLAGDPVSIIKVPVGTKLTITFSQTGISDPIDLTFPSLAPGDVTHSGNTYTVTPSAVGTSVFQPGTNPEAPKQIAMGLVGVLIVTPANCADTTTLKCAFDGTAYNDEAVVATTDLDPEFAADPAHFEMSYFGQARDASNNPRTVYHVINGKAFPHTDVINAAPSDKVLLRYVNAGVSDRSMGLLGLRQTLMARNASKYTDPQEFIAPLIGPGETADVAVTIPDKDHVAAGQEYSLMDQSKQMGHGNGAGFGNALTFISIWKGERPAPTAAITSYDGTTLVGTGTATATEAKIASYSTFVGASAPAAGDPAWTTTPIAPVDQASPYNVSTPVTAAHGATIWLSVTDTNGKTSTPVSTKVAVDAPVATVSIDTAGNVTGTGTSDATATITAAEYFIGADPGAGSGTAMSGTFGSASVTDLAGPAPVADGTTVSLRVKDSNGTWSAVVTATYTAPGPTPTPAPVAAPTATVSIDANGVITAGGSADATRTISAAEYFVGSTDPGAGFATPVSGTFGTQTVSGLTATPVPPLALGDVVSVRVQDSAGIWSAVQTATYTG